MTVTPKSADNPGGPDFDDLKELAKELGRPVTTLVALEVSNDPFYIGPKRQLEAEWFAELWRRFDCKPGAHGRRVHYNVISQEQPVKMPNGQPYENTLKCFGFLCEASRDARYLDLVGLRDMADRRSDEAIINLSDEEATEAEIAFEGGLHEHVPPGFDVPALGISAPIIPQRYHIEIWVEKSTMNDILKPLGERYGINVVYGVGK